jgi:hypothetical protein
MMDDSSEQFDVFEIIPDMVYAMRISDDEVEIFINDSQVLKFSQYALDLLAEKIDPFRT